MGFEDREWRLIPEEAHDGPVNMAFDEIAGETAATGGPRTLRVYRWEPSTLSLGYHQASNTVDWDFCEREGIRVTRRPTGGGGIYHDTTGDISYSIVAPADELPGDLMESYHILLEPILDAFKRMGVSAYLAEESKPALYEPACYLLGLHPAHDVVVDGRKVSGNAQYRQKDVIIQHGSITYARKTERHLGVFAAPGVTPDGFEGRVTSIREQSGIERHEVVAALEAALTDWANANEGSWRAGERTEAAARAEAKYETDEWTRRH